MQQDLTKALELVEAYNRTYHTNFKPTEKWRLFPGEDGVCEFKDQCWPCKDQAGVYLILSDKDEVIYIGQSTLLGSRFYRYFEHDNDTCVIRSPYWTLKPTAIVAIPVEDDRKYERLSLEEFLIKELQPIDNTRGK